MSEDVILRSWKEIAEYLKADRKTCARWEADFGLPVRRVESRSGRSRVFAYKAEIDRWLVEKAAPHPAVSAPPAKRKVSVFVLAAAAVAFVGPAIWLVGRWALPSGRPAPTIAVFAVRHESLAQNEFYIAEGLIQELLLRLSFGGRAQVQFLSAPAARSDAASSWPADIARPDYMLESDLKTESGQYVFEVFFKEFSPARLLWMKTYRASRDGLRLALDEICDEIRLRLPAPGSEHPSREGEIHSAAWDPYLKANFLLSRADGESSDPWSLYHKGVYYSNLGEASAIELAVGFFNEALALDPSFGPAYIGLANCYIDYINVLGQFDPKWLTQAETLAARGQSLDTDSAASYALRIKALLVREIAFGGDFSRSYFDLAKSGLARYPSDARLNSMVGQCYFRRYDREGRESDLEQALLCKKRAYWADRAFLFNIGYVEMLTLKRRFDTALTMCQELEKQIPSPWVLYRRAEVLYYSGQLDASAAIFQTCTAPVDFKVGALYYLGMIAARKKDRPTALEALRQIDVLGPQRIGLYLDDLREASIFAGLGETERAEGLIRKAFAASTSSQGMYVKRKYMEIDRNFDEIRSRFVLRGAAALFRTP